MSKNAIIEIDLTPELQEYYQLIVSEDYDFSDDEVVNILLNTGKYSRPQVGTIMILARDLGCLAEDSIFWTDKKCLLTGSGLSIQHINKIKAKSYILPNGKEVKIRQSVAVIGSQLTDETQPENAPNEMESSQMTNVTQVKNAPKYTPTISPESRRSAENYILEIIKNDLINHMAIFAANGGDCKELGKKYKKVVAQVVKEFV